jgi:hypothetical protein
MVNKMTIISILWSAFNPPLCPIKPITSDTLPMFSSFFPAYEYLKSTPGVPSGSHKRFAQNVGLAPPEANGASPTFWAEPPINGRSLDGFGLAHADFLGIDI